MMRKQIQLRFGNKVMFWLTHAWCACWVDEARAVAFILHRAAKSGEEKACRLVVGCSLKPAAQ